MIYKLIVTYANEIIDVATYHCSTNAISIGKRWRDEGADFHLELGEQTPKQLLNEFFDAKERGEL